MHIRPGRPDEAAWLTELALRSKAHWGYDEQFLVACREELTLRPEEIATHRTLVAEVDARSVGFVTVVGAPPIGEIGALFVEPSHIGGGIGRALFERTVRAARDDGFTRLTIDADPAAEPFYVRMGAVRIGAVPSGSIPGRMLPRLEYELASDAIAAERRM